MTALLKLQRFFDGVAPRWILDTEKRRAQLADVFKAYDLPCDGPALDIGSGASILAPFLLEAGPRSVFEVEISRSMLLLGRELHPGLHGLHFLQSDAHVLPFRDGVFGSVHCFSAFPHLIAPDAALAEFRRCLQPGATLCILHLMNHEELNALHRGVGDVVADDVLPPVETLSRDVQQAGFTVMRAEERPGLYLLTARASHN